MKTLTKKNITNYAKKQGLTIAIGHATEWAETGSKIRLDFEKIPKRAYAFSTLINGFWHEPSRYYTSLKDLYFDLLEELEYLEQWEEESVA